MDGFFHLLRGEEPGEVLVSPEVSAVMTRLPSRVCPVVDPADGPRGHCPGLSPEDEDFLGWWRAWSPEASTMWLRPSSGPWKPWDSPSRNPGVSLLSPAEGSKDRSKESHSWSVAGSGSRSRSAARSRSFLVRWTEEGGRETASPIFVAADGAHVGILVIADQPRVGAREALEALRETGSRRDRHDHR